MRNSGSRSTRRFYGAHREKPPCSLFPLRALREPLLKKLILALCLVSLTACGANIGDLSTRPIAEGDPQRGLQLIQQYGCPACHVIPGTRGVKAWVGPPLENWSARHYIAGSLPNTPENLIEWIRFPQTIEPGNAMPDLGVTDEDARDISAYLYTLRDD